MGKTKANVVGTVVGAVSVPVTVAQGKQTFRFPLPLRDVRTGDKGNKRERGYGKSSRIKIAQHLYTFWLSVDSKIF
jgi:hypothetical protein